jgi:adenylate kinase family enzyme
MHKIVILGAAGSGKSTFSRKLGQKLTIPVYHLDQLFLKANWEAVSTEDRFKIQSDIIQTPAWIIEGNYGKNGLMLPRFQAADTILILNLSPWVCLLRAIKRRILNHNKSRIDVPEGCIETLNLEFIQKHIFGFRKTKLAKIKQRLNETGKVFTEFKTTRQLDDFLARI